MSEVEDRWTAQVAEQYAALGRFVVSFEMMVHTVRSAAAQRLTAGVLHQRLVNVVLHHSVFTAGPLMEVLRALCAEILKEPAYVWDEQDADAITGTLNQVSGEYGKLLKMRNAIVHGTWFVGARSAQQTDFSDMHFVKFKATAAGFSAQDGPRTADDLLQLCTRCNEVTKLVRTVDAVMVFRDIKAHRNLVKKDGKWTAPGAAEVA